MKKYIYILICLLANLTSCDYLDIVPDERSKEEDAFKDKEAARRYLYSCYSYLPNPNDAAYSLDFLTSDEVVTAFEHEPFANFPKGNFTAATPGISYWNTLFSGIRQCYIFNDNMDKVPGLEDQLKKDYRAQLNFLIGYYHLLLVRCYGPTILITETTNVLIDPENYLARNSMEECINFICQKFEESIADLPNTRENIETGLATSVAAKALKAYTLMYYASPLFNGNESLASQLVNHDGKALLDPKEDRSRWIKARDAYKEAILSSHEAGHELYKEEAPKMNNQYPENSRLRILRANLVSIVKYNKEEIWTRNYNEGPYGIQKKSMPFAINNCYNGVSPTMNMLNRFYTVNGLPYNVDPLTKNKELFSLVALSKDNAIVSFADNTSAQIAEVGATTSQMNLNREPRYYAWISYHNGYYEITNRSYSGGYDGNASMKKYKNQQMVTNFLKGGNCGQTFLSPNGFLNKKGVHPDNIVGQGSTTLKTYPFPIIRLSELYLGYAECCAEIGTTQDIDEAKTYLNLIRNRAGIPNVDDSWEAVGGINGAKHLRDIVRQERQIELYLECHSFWDMRRWKLADKYFGHKHSGMDPNQTNIYKFSVETEVPYVRQFKENHWLLPIPSKDINNNHNLLQNPGY